MYLEKFPTRSCPSRLCLKISQCLHVWLRCFSNNCLCVESWKEYSLDFLQLFGSLRCKLHWFSKSDGTGHSFPGAGSPTRAQIPLSFGGVGSSTVVISFLLVCHCIGGGVGWFLTRLSACLSYVSQCSFIYIFSCRKSVLLVFRLFSKTVFYM